jgi:hypothetical protein
MTDVGFTGSRTGMTPEQRVAVLDILGLHRGEGARFSHGDCVGCDEEAHSIAMELGYIVHVWPPENSAARAFTTGHFIHAPRPYRVRDQSIVMMSGVLVAAPSGPEDAPDQKRSGTWMTIRMARKRGIEIYLVRPDGTVEREEPDDRAVHE